MNSGEFYLYNGRIVRVCSVSGDVVTCVFVNEHGSNVSVKVSPEELEAVDLGYMLSSVCVGANSSKYVYDRVVDSGCVMIDIQCHPVEGRRSVKLEEVKGYMENIGYLWLEDLECFVRNSSQGVAFLGLEESIFRGDAYDLIPLSSIYCYESEYYFFDGLPLRADHDPLLGYFYSLARLVNPKGYKKNVCFFVSKSILWYEPSSLFMWNVNFLDSADTLSVNLVPWVDSCQASFYDMFCVRSCEGKWSMRGELSELEDLQFRDLLCAVQERESLIKRSEQNVLCAFGMLLSSYCNSSGSCIVRVHGDMVYAIEKGCGVWCFASRESDSLLFKIIDTVRENYNVSNFSDVYLIINEKNKKLSLCTLQKDTYGNYNLVYR